MRDIGHCQTIYALGSPVSFLGFSPLHGMGVVVAGRLRVPLLLGIPGRDRGAALTSIGRRQIVLGPQVAQNYHNSIILI